LLCIYFIIQHLWRYINYLDQQLLILFLFIFTHLWGVKRSNNILKNFHLNTEISELSFSSMRILIIVFLEHGGKYDVFQMGLLLCQKISNTILLFGVPLCWYNFALFFIMVFCIWWFTVFISVIFITTVLMHVKNFHVKDIICSRIIYIRWKVIYLIEEVFKCLVGHFQSIILNYSYTLI